MPKNWIIHSWKPRRGINPCIQMVGEVQDQIQPRLNRPSFPCWIMDYELENYGRYRTVSARMPWRPRRAKTAHLYPPHAKIWEDTRAVAGPRHSFWILFAGGREVGLDRLIHPRFRYARFLDETDEIATIFRLAVLIGQERGEDGFWHAQQLLCHALALILDAKHVEHETWRLAAQQGICAEPGLAQKVHQFLGANLAERVTLPQIARHVRVSVSTLSHAYCHATGETPLTTYMKLRIERARILIMQGLPLKVIAEQLGFSDAFHLSKTFKRLNGVAPRRFKQTQRSRETHVPTSRFSKTAL